MDINIFATAEISDLAASRTVIFASDVTRYFDPEFYKDKGYQDAISLNQESYYLKSGTFFESLKFI